MILIPVSIEVLENSSDLTKIPKTVDLNLNIRVIGSGDFSQFVKNDKIDAVSIAIAILEGNIEIKKLNV